MTTDELRAKFEARFPRLDLSKDGYGNYYNAKTLMHFYGWLAAHASRDAEVEALRKDAERYKLLRSCSGHQAPFCVTQNIGHDWIIIRREELDEAIDAAMLEESK